MEKNETYNNNNLKKKIHNNSNNGLSTCECVYCIYIILNEKMMFFFSFIYICKKILPFSLIRSYMHICGL